MITTPIPSADYLRECFLLVGSSLVWKHRPESHFPAYGKRSSKAIANMWNAKNAGKVAGREMVGKCNYRQLGLNGARYLEHRIIAAMHGISTDDVIDHIDGNVLNNNPENLRPASHHQNCLNRIGWKSRNERPGVYERKRLDGSVCWIAVYSNKSLGTFDCRDEAIAARISAENSHRGEFSPNYRVHRSPTSIGRDA